MTPKLYGPLAQWWPLFSPPDNYAQEASFILEALGTRPDTLLELGSGGGNTASYLAPHTRLTLVDLSAQMLQVSQGLNPLAEHIQGDMRELRLGRTFEAVLIHDAIMYMTSRADLVAALRTARLHLERGRLIVLPDYVAESFQPGVQTGGQDGEGRGLRYMVWTHAPRAGTAVHEADYVILLRDAQGEVEVIHDRHRLGLFARAVWREAFLEAGFQEPERVVDPWGREVFLAYPVDRSPAPRLEGPGVSAEPGRLCLNMIVKNEAHVITRCLESVRPWIDRWVIVDTGSTDGTQDLIRSLMSGISGQLHERPWKNFAYNRSEAIELARGQAPYLLVMDADDILEAPPDFQLPSLEHDCYELRVEYAGFSYYRAQIFRSDHGYRYEGVLHECLASDQEWTSTRLEGLIYRVVGGGGRSADPERYRRDAAILEAELAEHPDDRRSAFYLAQSYRDAGDLEKSVAAYSHRSEMGGWDEEVWVSLIEVGRLSERLGRDESGVVAAYLRAFEYRPRRAESLYELARFYRERARYALGYIYAQAALAIPRPEDRLFLDSSVYAWRALDESAVCGYWVGKEREALEANRRLLAMEVVPAHERARLQANLEACLIALGEEVPSSDTSSEPWGKALIPHGLDLEQS